MKEYRFAIAIQMIFIGVIVYFNLFTALEGLVVLIACITVHLLDAFVNILNAIKDKK